VPVKLESRKERKTQLATLPPMIPSGLDFSVKETGKDEGVLVASVKRGSPADSKGLLSGDRIVAVNGEPINNQAQFDLSISTIGKGSPIFLLVWRNGEKFHLGLEREN
jgi:S1-C subfamily serine protease